MKKFAIIVDNWESPGGPPPELAKTNATMKIQIESEVITRLLDIENKTVRDSVYMPLYPLAEWIASNWWRLLYEPKRRGSEHGLDYRNCHELILAGEGYFLPDLKIASEENDFCLTWKKRTSLAGQYDYISAGSEKIPFAEMEAGLRTFVNTVIERLHAFEIKDTLLEKDWNAIQQSGNDRHEREFCIAAARLGMDPYALSDDQAETILRVYHDLKDIVNLPEYFCCASKDSLLDDSEQLRVIANNMLKSEKTNKALIDCKKNMVNTIKRHSGDSPWEEGYLIANEVRTRLFDGKLSLDNLHEIVNTSSLPYQQKLSFCRGLTGISKAGTPAFYAPEGIRSPATNFIAGRMLGDYFCNAHPGKVQCISDAKTRDQQKNRAFAAELLLPAAELRARLADRKHIDEEEISDLASEYQISDYTVKHQLCNHRIAGFSTSPSA